MARNWIGLACPIRHNSNPSNFPLISSICLFLGTVSLLLGTVGLCDSLLISCMFISLQALSYRYPQTINFPGIGLNFLPKLCIANATSYLKVQKPNEQEYLDILTFHIIERRNLAELLCIVPKACGCHKVAMLASTTTNTSKDNVTRIYKS